MHIWDRADYSTTTNEHTLKCIRVGFVHSLTLSLLRLQWSEGGTEEIDGKCLWQCPVWNKNDLPHFVIVERNEQKIEILLWQILSRNHLCTCTYGWMKMDSQWIECMAILYRLIWWGWGSQIPSPNIMARRIPVRFRRKWAKLWSYEFPQFQWVQGSRCFKRRNLFAKKILSKELWYAASTYLNVDQK